ncbi:hypothetical protein [Photobacterium kishitanii]|uniref:Uncharacterized protein n=1 Tax=Photobacterium kishitanii TaxID=318456 RepID=A0A2T3KKY3_9GAMM|nr:hypothetical protein [Photobacterium kishitanii]PSV00326.1 hypothetical protein C9J27_04160 [Photobacterium kishitanii]
MFSSKEFVVNINVPKTFTKKECAFFNVDHPKAMEPCFISLQDVNSEASSLVSLFSSDNTKDSESVQASYLLSFSEPISETDVNNITMTINRIEFPIDFAIVAYIELSDPKKPSFINGVEAYNDLKDVFGVKKLNVIFNGDRAKAHIGTHISDRLELHFEDDSFDIDIFSYNITKLNEKVYRIVIPDADSRHDIVEIVD